jgi:hypothetical protein
VSAADAALQAHVRRQRGAAAHPRGGDAGAVPPSASAGCACAGVAGACAVHTLQCSAVQCDVADFAAADPRLHRRSCPPQSTARWRSGQRARASGPWQRSLHGRLPSRRFRRASCSMRSPCLVQHTSRCEGIPRSNMQELWIPTTLVAVMCGRSRMLA